MLIWDLRVFTRIELLQDRGSIASRTDVLGADIYQIGIGSSDVAMAGAMSIVFRFLTIVISWACVRHPIEEHEQ